MTIAVLSFATGSAGIFQRIDSSFVTPSKAGAAGGRKVGAPLPRQNAAN
jgi:hypothetical protein